MKKKYIIKASGEQEEFDIEKFKRSLQRCGASDSSINTLAQEIQENPELLSTKDIHSYTLKKLCVINRPVAARYNLKNALFEFGPTGFPFERFVAELYKAQGFKTEVGKIIKGWCVSHETDVIAHKDKKHFLVECKFHNNRGVTSHVQTPLYVKARFDDLVKQWKSDPTHSQELHGACVVTNTRFTPDATQYGECVGLAMIGWSYPKDDSLQKQIDATGLHPITALTTLTLDQKKQLLSENFVLCRDVDTYKHLLKNLNLSEKRTQNVIEEAHGVCEISA